MELVTNNATGKFGLCAKVRSPHTVWGADEVTAHGLRATASTLLNESGKWQMDAIERALAHGHSDAVRGTYARGQHWEERVEMAQWWSDYLDTLRKGADVVPIRRAGSA